VRSSCSFTRRCNGDGHVDGEDQASEPAATRPRRFTKPWLDAARNCWRVRYTIDGAIKTKDLRIADDSPKGKAEAEAVAFCASL
jgi:hypothetical protein